MNNIVVIGVGNIGSRHLQALKKINLPLKIYAIDPNSESLSIAKKRFDSIDINQNKHQIKYLQKIETFGETIDLAIIATNSNIRREVIEKLLELNDVKYFILEKLLFQKKDDYYSVEKLLKDRDCKAWVNFTRRMIPIYDDKIKKLFHKKKVFMCATGGGWGLISTGLHYLDYMIYLLENNDFSVDTRHLNPNLIKSKRTGFWEISGILQVHFKCGSSCIFISYPSGDLPISLEIFSDTLRCVINETNEQVWHGLIQNISGTKFFEVKTQYISDLTTINVEKILKNGYCSLVTYKESILMHLTFLDSIQDFLNNNLEQEFTYYPFT